VGGKDLQSVLDAVLDGVIVLDREGRIEHVNPEACRILEVSAESAASSPVEALLGAEHAVARLSRSVLATGRPAIEDEVAVERRGASGLEVDVAVSPIDTQERRVSGVVMMLRDRTISNSLRELIAQREKLASFGQIAAGIAHEVKNPLGGIRGAAELLGMWTDDERAHSTSQMIVREVDRIAALVDELMVFARDEALREEPLNLHFALDGMLDLLAMDPLSERVKIERCYDPSIPEFLGEVDRLRQVFLNLARNALQAMEQSGGTLTITTRMTLDHRLSGSNGRRMPTVMVAFSDTGPGIPSEILDRLATPFFTTRPQGTGLGLAVSRHWVTRHGGTLRISSSTGEGTTARVALPLRRDK
jgi:two-component system nitrogen regulation sensor histidine kinase GlnL